MGGGYGHVLLELLKANPKLTGMRYPVLPNWPKKASRVLILQATQFFLSIRLMSSKESP